MLLDILKLIGAILLLIVILAIYAGLAYLMGSALSEGIRTAPTWATAYAIAYICFKLLTLGK